VLTGHFGPLCVPLSHMRSMRRSAIGSFSCMAPYYMSFHFSLKSLGLLRLYSLYSREYTVHETSTNAPIAISLHHRKAL
jgi:hypothetical protein